MNNKIMTGFEAVDPAPSVVAIGFFDGVHRGHQSLILRASKTAHDRGVRSVVITFDRHPLEVVNPGARPPLLMTLDQRLRALAAQPVDLVVAVEFDDELRHLSPSDFVEYVLAGPVQARHVVVGANFRFGHKAAGDVTTLADLGPVFDFTSEGVTLLQMEDTVVSSTEIRAALEEGRVEQAARWLGRPHVVEGVVIRGDQRGRELGYPTANLQVNNRSAIPAEGVYASRFRLPDDTWHPAASSIGLNPTFGGVTQIRVEVYLIDWDGDLYGVQAAVDFRHRLRGQIKFDSVTELTTQMRQDVDQARRLLESDNH